MKPIDTSNEMRRDRALVQLRVMVGLAKICDACLREVKRIFCFIKMIGNLWIEEVPMIRTLISTVPAKVFQL